MSLYKKTVDDWYERETFKLGLNFTAQVVKVTYLKKIEELNNILKNENNSIKKKLNTKQVYSNEQMKEFDNMSIYEILHKEFRFLSPMTYDKMIEKWEQECEKFNCNHMAVEYPEFAKPIQGSRSGEFKEKFELLM